MADGLTPLTPPPRDDSTRRVVTGRVHAVALDSSRQALVRVEAGTGVVFTPLDGGPETTWPFLRRRMVEQLVVAPDGTLHAATLQGVLTLAEPRIPDVRKIGGGALCIAIDDQGRHAVGTGRGEIWLGDDHPGFNGYQAHESRVEAIARRHHIIVSGGADARIVWADLHTEQATAFSGHVAGITALALHTRAISGSADGSIKAWGGPEAGLLWSTKLPGGGPVHALAHTGTHILASGRDRAIYTLSPEDGRVLGLHVGHSRSVAGIFPLADGTFWSFGRDRSLRHWATPAARNPPPFFGHSDGVRAVLVEAGTLHTASRDGTIRTWDLTAQAPTGKPFQVSAGAVQVLARATPDTLFFGTTEGTVGIVDARGRTLHRQSLHEGPVTCLARLGPHHLLSGGADGVLRTWDAQRLTPLSARTHHTDRVRCMAVLPHADNTVVTGSYDGTLARVSPFGGPPLARMTGHTRPVVGVAATGTSIASGSLDGTVRTWRLDGTPIATETADPDGVVGVVTVAPERIVTVGKSGCIALWSTPDLERLATHTPGVPLDGVGSGHTADGQPVVVIGDQRGGITVLALTSG